MWFEILKTGKFKDSRGREHEFTDTDLDRIVATYDPAHHEAPIVIGHPKDNAPAFGWVEGLKRVGHTLFAEADNKKKLIPEFLDMLKRGLFKKRSASFYEDGMLRHVGFLGAMPPAVKGLADIEFSAEEGATIEFDEGYRLGMIGRVFQRLREFIIDKFDTDTADRIVGNWEIEELQRQSDSETVKSSFSDNGTQTKEDEMLEELKRQIQELQGKVSSFTEQLKAKDREIETLKSDNMKIMVVGRRAEFSSFCDELMDEGRMTPVQKSQALDFMEILQGIGEYEFSEDDGKKEKRAPLDAFKAFLSSLPKQVEFSEIARKGNARSSQVDGTKREEAIQDYMEKHSGTDYKEAVLAVSKDHPQLFEER